MGGSGGQSFDEPVRLRGPVLTAVQVDGLPSHGSGFGVAGPRGPGDTSRTIGFRVDDLDAALEELRAAGVSVDEPGCNDRQRYAHFHAPDGKRYELVEERAG